MLVIEIMCQRMDYIRKDFESWLFSTISGRWRKKASVFFQLNITMLEPRKCCFRKHFFHSRRFFSGMPLVLRNAFHLEKVSKRFTVRYLRKIQRFIRRKIKRNSSSLSKITNSINGLAIRNNGTCKRILICRHCNPNIQFPLVFCFLSQIQDWPNTINCN